MKNPYGYMSMANQADNNKARGSANGGWGMTTGQDDTKAFSAQRSLMGPMDSANDFNGQASFGQGAGGGQELSAQGAYGGRSGWAPPQSVNRSAYNAVAPQRTAAQQNRWNNRSGGNFSNSVPDSYRQGIPSSNGAQQFGMGEQDPFAGYGGNGNPVQGGGPMQKNRNRMGGGGNGASVMGADGSIEGIMYSTDTVPPPGRGEPGAGVEAPPNRGGAGSDPINNPAGGQGGGQQQGNSLLRPYSPYGNTGIYPAGDFFTGQGQKWWDDASNQAAAQAFTNSMSPLYQIQEGGRQFNATELEGARRFDAEFGRTDRNDLWGQGFAERQQGEAERVAGVAEEQWGKDFEWGKSQDMFGRGIATGELDLAKLTQSQRNALDTGQLNLAQLTQQQRNAIEQGQLGLANRQQTENNAIERGQLALSQLTQQQRNAVESGQLNLANLTQQQKYVIEQAQMALANRQENNQSALDREKLKLAGLTQQQSANVDRARLGLDQMTQTQLNQYRNQQLAQEAALSRENMKNQMAMQTMQAFGRTQAPNVRFMRNWG